jgi:hypothetical protein
MAIILISFGNKKEEICYPIQKKTSFILLKIKKNYLEKTL